MGLRSAIKKAISDNSTTHTATRVWGIDKQENIGGEITWWIEVSMSKRKRKTKSLAERVAVEFSNILHSWLTSKQMSQVVKKNATDAYRDACATHDYCDANEAMAEAFKNITGKDPSPMNERQLSVFNKAWEIAKDNNFKTKSK